MCISRKQKEEIEASLLKCMKRKVGKGEIDSKRKGEKKK